MEYQFLLKLLKLKPRRAVDISRNVLLQGERRLRYEIQHPRLHTRNHALLLMGRACNDSKTLFLELLLEE